MFFVRSFFCLLIACSSIGQAVAQTPPREMDLRQLWNELKLNNPQLTALREGYLSAKAVAPQIAAPANPQLGLVWSGIPPNSPLGLGNAGNAGSANNSISIAQPFSVSW